MFLEKRWAQYVFLLLMALIWGSSFILMKIGLKSFDSNQAAAIRIFSASAVLLPVSIYHLRKLKWHDLRGLLIAGFIGSFFPAFLFTKAQTQIDSAMAGMLNSLTPMFTLLIGILFYNIQTSRMQVIGMLLGLVGAAGLISWGEDLSLANINSYAFYIVLATFFYGISMNEIKIRLAHLTGMQITGFMFLLLLPAALGYLLYTDFDGVTQNPAWGYHLLALVTLGVVGTALALTLMNTLIGYVQPVFVSSTTYIVPVFAVFWGVVDGEQVLPVHILFMLLILFGVYLINTKGKIRIVAHARLLRRKKF
ncbi:MAG: EamA family transporter [Salinivirgaceae bacterium]|nr:EamA family transporter [Salinivirgaceae bacterium]